MGKRQTFFNFHQLLKFYFCIHFSSFKISFEDFHINSQLSLTQHENIIV